MVKQIVVVLHNIRSIHNVGSIFRTCDAAGISEIILSGYTPLPVDRFNRERKDFTKVSLGAELTVPWSHTKNITISLKKLQKENFEIIAVEQNSKSLSLFKYKKTKQKIVVMFGNEIKGISSQLLQKADTILEIPMHGKKESLNVSVTAGIALFSLLH